MNNQHRALIIRRLEKITGKLDRVEVELNHQRDNNAFHVLIQANTLLMDAVIKFDEYEKKDSGLLPT